jgi:transposase-like protein
MDRDVCVPRTGAQRQEAAWAWIQDSVEELVVDLMQHVLEWEQEARLGAAWNQRSHARSGYRNGYRPRQLGTPYGPLRMKIPRCRQGGLDTSLLFDRYQRRIADVDRILRHAYLLGVSTRGTAELAEQVFGGQLSHQTVSRLTRWLQDQLDRWRRRPIEPVYPVVHIDGMHVNVVGGDRNVMLVTADREDGSPEVLGFCLSTGEQCRELLQDLRDRGLEGVELFVSDESGAIRSALEQVYPEVAWQHCTFHRLAALRQTVGPTDYRNLMLAEAACVFRCPSKRAAVDAALAWGQKWRPVNPGGTRQFLEDLENSLMFYNLPADRWQRVRTNNPLERLIRTLRMRLDPIGCFHDEPAVERAVFGQLARWHFLGTYTQ